MLVFIASDHRGFNLKGKLIPFLKESGHEVLDLGPFIYKEDDDYPDYASLLAEKVLETKRFGILICGSAAGASIAANKYKGARAFIAMSSEQAEAAKKDDDTNILSLAADYLSEDQAKKIVAVWLAASFSGEERHVRRLEKVRKIEDQNFK